MSAAELTVFESPVPDYQLSLEEQQALLEIQHSVLEMVAGNSPEQEVFESLCLMAESLLPNAVSSIMMQQENGELDVICAPSVPPEGRLRLNGLRPGPTGGSCGNAVYTNEQVFVVDAVTDERCGDTRELFKEFGLCACWSTPVRDVDGKSIGSFALSSFEIRTPSNFHKQLLAVGAHIIGIILQRSKQQQQLEFMAYKDPLTGLSNRTCLFNQIQAATETVSQNQSDFALLFLDLNRFKNLNDTFGHTVGDTMLRTISQRLLNKVKGSAELARVGGDEFVLLVANADEAEEVASKVLEVLTLTLEYESHQFQIDGSIGIALYPQDGESAEILLKNADTAMYHAKKHGKGFAFYEPALGLKAKQAFTIESDLHRAIENQEFKLFYQPLVSAQTQELEGIEALIRWFTPDNGMVSPADFIPIAEHTGLIIPMGEWVVETALRQAEELAAYLNKPFNLSINISGAQLLGEHVDRLLSLINQSQFPNHHVVLEVTETFLVQEADSASDQLEKIRAAGVKIAIDDFGIGYSSLAYLKRFNVNTLKIDRMLVQDINTDADDLAITKAVIALGQSLGLTVVAEGVETQQQATTLQGLGCDLLQGFHFSKPVPLDELKAVSSNA
ncbi:MAG: sensor domain-containing phosphodiesterase [Neptuniibacter sp.]